MYGRFSIYLISFLISASLFAGECSSTLSLFFESDSINKKLQTLLTKPTRIPSLAQQHPHLMDRLFEIQEMIPSKKETQALLEIRLKRPPTIEEMVTEIHQEFHRKFLPAIEQIGTIDPILKEFSNTIQHVVNRPFDSLAKAVHHSPKLYNAKFDPNISAHMNVIDGYVGQAYGEMGEIIVASRTSNLISHARHFKNFGDEHSQRLGNLIAQKITSIRKRLLFSDMDNLIEKYPRIFHTTNGNGDLLTHEQIIERSINWLFSKEIDVISNSRPGKMAWIEVKNYSSTVSFKRFRGHHPGSKSIESQLKSYIQIVKLLELQDIVEIKIRFEKFGADPEVIKYITDMGIEVI